MSGDVASQSRGATLAGRRVSLRPIELDDYDWVYPLALTSPGAQYWRFRGRQPSVERFIDELWSGVEVQLVMETIDDRLPIGLAQLLRVDLVNGVASLSAIMQEQQRLKGWTFEGFLLFLRFAFQTYPLRKVYLEVLEPALDRYRGAVGRFLDHEGVLTGHQYVDGRYHDLHYLALTRGKWDEQAALVDRVVGSPTTRHPAPFGGDGA